MKKRNMKKEIDIFKELAIERLNQYEYKLKRVTQADLAHDLQIDPATLNKIIKGVLDPKYIKHKTEILKRLVIENKTYENNSSLSI